jgi:hypothetical protein
MTYQAVQVVGSSSQEDEFKNRHQNPDLGIWNCCVYSKGDKKQPLVDSLLTKVVAAAAGSRRKSGTGTGSGGRSVRTFCLTVDLSEEALVEPTMTLLQGALVRHLIENPPPTAEDNENEHSKQRQTSTTSLYDLQATQFGLASSDPNKASTKNLNDSYKAVTTTLMICAQLPLEPEEVSEQAYKKKQATALIIYHLRKFAAAINASLCFIQPANDANNAPNGSVVASPTTKESSQQQAAAPATPAPPQPQSRASTQPTVNYEKLAQLWRDLALDQTVWMTDTNTTTTTTTSSTDEQPPEPEDDDNNNVNDGDEHSSTPLYGPGRHQEDLIDTVLLRNANYPGHWDATKDSLWVALPTPPEASQEAALAPTGDEGWLGQLRTSIAADVPKPVSSLEPTDKEEKPKQKDAAVSSFFESLLKNP